MLMSYCRWLPHGGHSGLVVTLDFRPYEFKRVAKGRRQTELLRRINEAVANGASSAEIQTLLEADARSERDLYYSDAAYLQMLTLLRRFIDEIDRFERFLLVVLTTPNFYKQRDQDAPSVQRSYFDYDALQTRIGQEVYDTRYPNPAAALVRLKEAA